MAAAVRLREGVSGTELRREAVRAKDANRARRLLALAAVADGASRAQAATIGGMDRQTLRDWVHRFNEAGVAGLINARSPGRPPKLGPEQKAWLKGVVEKGPDLARDGVVRWRCVDLKRVVKGRFGVECDEDTIGRALKQLGFSHISPRPQHQARDEDALAAFKKNFTQQVAAVLAGVAPSTPIEIWFQDEMRVGQKNSLVRQWAPRGSRPRQPRDQRYGNAYLFGAVCPTRDAGAALVLPDADTWAMQRHLDEISRHVAPGAHAGLILDKAGWHTTGKLKVPPNISLLSLPPQSPELNPTGNIWQHLRQTWLSNRVFASYEAIVAACCEVWNKLTAEAGRIRSIASRDGATIGQ